MSWENLYPFTAIVGQEKMKTALLLNAVCPQIGGVLIRGQKGTAKSTLVRSLSVLLPEIEVVEGCPFSCDPHDPVNLCEQCSRLLTQTGSLPSVRRKVQVVDLPIGTTEDRVVGTIDLERAIQEGKKCFEPGLLARAHRGILYIDEVNLLNDHIVDVILDAAASGVNIVEREGVSYCHPARFILVGTMNPEEGELRPQLIDRFGMCVTVEGCSDQKKRVAIMIRREGFDRNPADFLQEWEQEQEKTRQKIRRAINRLPSVTISEELLGLCSRLAMEAFVAGHRADIILRWASLALASFMERKAVQTEDIEAVADMVLFHRKRQVPPPPPPQQEQDQSHDHDHHDHHDHQDHKPQEEKEEETSSQQPENASHNHQNSPSDEEEERGQENEHDDAPDQEQEPAPASAPLKERVFETGEPFRVKRFDLERDRKLRKGSGRRSRTKIATKSGRYVMSTMRRKNNDLALDATLRAAAPYQSRRRKENVAIAIESSDIREKIREKKIGNFIIFAIDASGSMGANKRMVAAKGAILSLLMDAYQKRDKVGLVAFKGDKAEVILPPTSSIELGYKLMEDLPAGGKTPLTHGLLTAYQLIETQLRKDPFIYPLLVLITDGRSNVSLYGDKPLGESLKAAEIIGEDDRVRTLVVDVEKKGFMSFGLSEKIARQMGAKYFLLEDLRASTLMEAVKGEMVDAVE
ncbi:MAG: putative cobaltochelatase [bacterium]